MRYRDTADACCLQTAINRCPSVFGVAVPINKLTGDVFDHPARIEEDKLFLYFGFTPANILAGAFPHRSK